MPVLMVVVQYFVNDIALQHLKIVWNALKKKKKGKNLIARNQLNYVSATPLIIAFVYGVFRLETGAQTTEMSDFAKFPNRFFLLADSC